MRDYLENAPDWDKYSAEAEHVVIGDKVLFVLGILLLCMPTALAAEAPLVTSVDELTTALMNAKDGDTNVILFIYKTTGHSVYVTASNDVSVKGAFSCKIQVY